MSCTIGLKVLINRPCKNISLDYYFRPVVALSWCFNLKVLTWVSICQSSLIPSDWVPLKCSLVDLPCYIILLQSNIDTPFYFRYLEQTRSLQGLFDAMDLGSWNLSVPPHPHPQMRICRFSPIESKTSETKFVLNSDYFCQEWIFWVSLIRGDTGLVGEGNLVHLTNRLVWFWFCDHCFQGNFMCQLGSVFQISSEMSLFSHSVTSVEIVKLHWYIGVRRCDISQGRVSSHGLPKFALEVFRKLHKSKILTFLYKISIDVS